MHTVKVWLHLSAAMLLLAKLASISFPSLASLSISLLEGLLGFSKTKKTRDRMAMNVVYMVNQYDPIKSPRLLISPVMWMMLRDTLTQAAAHAYERLSTLRCGDCEV